MKIEKNKVITIDYTLKDDEGTILDTSDGREPLSFIQGLGNIIPGLEKAFEGKNIGDSFSVSIAPDDAYGPYNEQMIFSVPADKFQNKDELKVGMQVQAQTEHGPQILSVIGIEGDEIKLDGNHPLAGMTLNFDIIINDVREATPEELDHGHVHLEGHSH